MWLQWRWAVGLALVLGAIGVAARFSASARLRNVGAFARETSLVLALYAVWNYAGRLSLVHVKEAFEHGRSVWDFERWLHLPSEASFEHAVLHSTPLIRALNVYYAAAHVPVLIACLVWLFVRHRDQYPSIRTTLALTTGACLLVQLIPVAPPRMYPELGFIDAGARFGPGVYGKVGTGISDQLSAMPSVHVAWAALVALAVIVASTSRWRYWILAHPVLTIVAVTATANHWWLDGVAALIILFIAWGLERGARRAWGLARARRSPGASPDRGDEALVEPAPDPGPDRMPTAV
jgi:PAP2 superfamily